MAALSLLKYNLTMNYTKQLIGSAALCGSVFLAKAETSANVIFFLSDDHRFDALGCAGHPIVETPTIDKLAAEGTRFSNAFVTTSICAASRASLFTGLYERTHLFTFGTPPIEGDHIADSYPAQLRSAGYHTGFVGKFGVGVGGIGTKGMFDVFNPLGRHPYHKKQKDGSTRHVSEIAGDKAIEFLDTAPKDKPFCLSVSFNAAHAEDGDKRPGIGHFPWPKAVDGLYDDVPIPAPRLGAPKIFESQPEFLRKSMNRDRWFWRWDTPEKHQINVRAYYRMITGLDRVMGRVLDELKKTGREKNTVVIFMGDNGYYQGNRGFAGKWSHYDDSLRVPLVIHDPRVPPSARGKVNELMTLNVDVPATILAAAGSAPPKRYQGRNLLGLVSGKKPKTWRDDTFCEHLMNNGSIPKWEGVRGSRYVYARYFEQNPPFEFLHDLKTDPDQLKNLAGDKAHKATLAKMRKRSDLLRDSYGGPFKPRSRGPKNKPKPKKK